MDTHPQHTIYEQKDTLRTIWHNSISRSKNIVAINNTYADNSEHEYDFNRLVIGYIKHTVLISKIIKWLDNNHYQYELMYNNYDRMNIIITFNH